MLGRDNKGVTEVKSIAPFRYLPSFIFLPISITIPLGCGTATPKAITLDYQVKPDTSAAVNSKPATFLNWKIGVEPGSRKGAS